MICGEAYKFYLQAPHMILRPENTERFVYFVIVCMIFAFDHA